MRNTKKVPEVREKITNADLLPLGSINGRTIKEIKMDEQSQCTVVLFVDGTFWVITAKNWNCAGARLVHFVSEQKDLG